MDTSMPQAFSYRSYSQSDFSNPIIYKMEGMYVIDGEEFYFLILETIHDGPCTTYRMHFFKSFGSMIDAFMETLRQFILLDLSRPELRFDTPSTIGYVESIEIDGEMQRPWFQAKFRFEIEGRIAKSILFKPKGIRIFEKPRAEGD